MENSNIRKQFKSKERISKHGEVFTDEKEVKSMCDLFDHECERVDSRFFEPACGNGNFLAEILSRKLELLEKKYKNKNLEFEKYSILALSSLYGVDILLDNVHECSKKIYEIWERFYLKNCKKKCNNESKQTALYILKKNIVCGNALTFKCVDETGKDTNNPIIFSEWSLIFGNKFKRRDFRFDHLLIKNEIDRNTDEYTLFLEDNNSTILEKFPKSIKEYRPIEYRKIWNFKD